MKKYLVGIAGGIGVGAVLFASYIGMGVLTERALKQTLQNLKITKGIQIQIAQYHRGWFHSNALLNWTLPSLPALSQQPSEVPHTLPLTLSITHGPLMLGAHGLRMGLGCAKGQLALPESYRAYLNETMDTGATLPVLKLKLWFAFFNRANVSATVPTFNLHAQPQQFQLDWLGLTGRSVVSLDLSELEGDLKARGLFLKRANTELTVGALSTDYTLHKSLLGLYTGTAHASLKSLQLITHKQIQGAIQGLTSSSVIGIQDDLLEGTLKLSLAGATMEGQHYGPGHLITMVQRVDAVVLTKIRQRMNAIQTLDGLSRQKALLTLLPDLAHLIEKGAVFSIPTFDLQTPQGLMEGSVMLSMPNEKLTSPFQVFSKLKGTGHVHLTELLLKNMVADAVRQRLEHMTLLPAVADLSSPSVAPTEKTLEEQIQLLTAKRMAAFLETGLFVKKGTDFYLDASLEDGRLSVNGKLFSPAMLAF